MFQPVDTTPKTYFEKILNEHDRNLPLRVSDAYVEPKNFEKEGTIYEKVGIKPFKKLVLATAGKLFSLAKKYPGLYSIGRGIRQDIGHYESWTRIAETLHLYCGYQAAEALIESLPEGQTEKILPATLGEWLMLISSCYNDITGQERILSSKRKEYDHGKRTN